MRSFSNFLLFEDFLEYLPPDSSIIVNAASLLVSPQVKIKEEDCGTLVGSKILLNSEAEGLIEISTGAKFTTSRIDYLLSQGIYSSAIRNTSSCMSEGGVCRTCFSGRYPDTTTPPVNSLIVLDSLYDKYIDVLTGDGYRTSFSLSQQPSLFPKVLVFQAGNIISTGFTISGTNLIFNTPPGLGVRTVIKYYIKDSSPLLGFFAKTFSGGLMGISELPTQELLIRTSLYESLLSNAYIDTLLAEIAKLSIIPESYIEYVTQIHSKLEKALYIIYLYSVYVSIQS